MAMTPQQARARALQLRSLQPELQSVAIDDLIAQVMATEGMGAPGAGSGGLADLFPPKTLSAASPAPMAAARFQAAKPTAAIIPAAGAGTDAFRRAKEVRERTDQGPTVGERTAANTRVDDLIAELPKASAPRPPEVAPVREESPVASALAAAEAPAKVTPSRYRPRLAQKQAELAQLKASVPASGETPTKLALDLDIVSREVNELANLVAAEEAAVANPERAAILERQTKRLGREEELVEQARKRAPFDALIAGGAALASARPGESFTSALTRGLAAGNESYSGARDAREASLRGIEEKRDTYSLQSIDAVLKARDEAIALQNAGAAMTEQQMRLAGMSREAATAAALAPYNLQKLKAETTEATVKADNAQTVIDTALAESRARTFNYMQPPAGGGVGGTGGAPSQAQATKQAEGSERDLKKLEKQILASEEDGNHPQTYELLRQYGRVKAKFNEVASAANRSPIIAKGFPITLRGFEAYVKKNGFPSGGAAPAAPSRGGSGTIVSSVPLPSQR